MRSAGSWFVVGVLIVSCPALAEHRVAIEPAVDVTQVYDDNLNYSADAPLRDSIRRITPTLSLRLNSPRWTALGTYGLDGERYANHSSFDNNRARERALVDIHYVAGPRLTLVMNSAYVDTNTPADFNLDTGLATSRVRSRQLSIVPSARFRISPRTTVTASASSINTEVENGIGLRARIQTLGVDRRVTERDRFVVTYSHNHSVFRGDTNQPMNTHVLLAGWTRELGARTNLMLLAGPRTTDGAHTLDLSAALGHNWRSTSIAISLERTQKTVIGYVGAVETQSAQTRLSYAPGRRLIAYAAPALIRSTQRQLQATVYRIGLGVRYEITSLLGFDVVYNLERQNGAIDPLHADLEFSHARLLLGFSTRWSSAESHVPGR